MLELLPFDFETTSPEPRTTRVVQVAAKHRGEFIFNQLCNPGLPISDGANEVHGITNEMVADAPSDEIVVAELARYVVEHQETVVLCGHNITTFDVPILWRIAGIANPPKIRVVDTLTCAIRCLPNAPNHKLEDLCTHLGLKGDWKAHDAAGDIGMVEALVKLFMDSLGYTLEELANWLDTPRVLKVCHFGKHKGKEWGKGPGKVPYFYAKYCSDNFDNMHPDVVATLRHHYNIHFKPK